MWQLVINGPGYFDTHYDLLEGVTHIGRADENDIVLSGDLVSRKHARLHLTANSLVLEDLGSRNGSKVNGESVTGKVPLRANDQVQLGENQLLIREATPAERASTDVVDTGAGGMVRRYGRGTDVANAVLVARDLSSAATTYIFDEFVPFEPSEGAQTGGMKQPEAKRLTDTDEDDGAMARAAGGSLAWQSLLLLYRVTERLTSATNLRDFLDDTMHWLMKRVKATTGVVLVRHSTGVMVPTSVVHSGALQKGEVPVSDAIIEASLKQGQAIAVGNVQTDERFSGRESVMVYAIDQVLCIPIGTAAPFAGVLYLNRPSGTVEPMERLLDLCTAIAQMVQTGIAKFQFQPGRDERLHRALERFHGPDIVERRIVELKTASGAALTSLEERVTTVMFADISGFTTLVQQLEPSRVLDLLNAFYRLATQLIFSFEGTVDKFMGDKVMALFGAPYSRGDDAIRAVRAAMAMKAEWAKVVRERPEAERLQLRVGLNTGTVLAGTVGSDARLDYTALGEPVNIASWLCSSASPGQVLLTGKSLASIGARFDVNPLGERPLFGSKARTAIFEVLDEDHDQGTLSGIR